MYCFRQWGIRGCIGVTPHSGCDWCWHWHLREFWWMLVQYVLIRFPCTQFKSKWQSQKHVRENWLYPLCMPLFHSNAQYSSTKITFLQYLLGRPAGQKTDLCGSFISYTLCEIWVHLLGNITIAQSFRELCMIIFVSLNKKCIDQSMTLEWVSFVLCVSWTSFLKLTCRSSISMIYIHPFHFE